MENISLWKKLVTRESTFLERVLRFEGYKDMLPPPFTVKQKDLLAVYGHGMTTQYIKADDFTSKIESIKNDINTIGFEKIIDRKKDILDNLDQAKDKLDKEKNFNAWKEFEACYKLARAIILYSSNCAIFLKQSQGNEKEIEILQRIYDDAEARSSGAWKDIAGFFESISKAKDISLHKMYLYTAEEFSGLLSEGIEIEDDVLDQRENLTVMKLENYESEILVGDKAKDALDRIIIEKDNVIENNKELHGSITYKGKVKGIVKLILSKSDYSKINEGDILVTFMTHPDMVPILSKAAGIITDEGGVLCHAAIIAREMKKPCIIGTNNATTLLRDGDFIQLDAEQGLVTVINQ